MLWVKKDFKYKKNAAKWSRQHARIQRRLSSTEGCLPPKVIFHWRSSSTEGRLPPNVVCCLPLKVVFQWRVSSTEGHLPLKVVFLRRSSSPKGRLPPKVIFHRRPSSINHNILVDLIFVRTVNLPNLSLLPCIEVASPPNVVFYWTSSSTEGRLPLRVVFHLP